MKNAFLCLVFVISVLGLCAQNCDVPNPPIRFSANNMITYLEASGSMFDGDDFGLATYSTDASIRPPATIFASGLWLGTFDSSRNMKLAASTYGRTIDKYDYYPGPLNFGDPNSPWDDPARGSIPAETCSNWNKVWLVHRSEITAFRQDYADDGQLQGQYPNVLGWPGYGNPSFAAYNGFDLPSNRPHAKLAPFWDINANGIYEPSLGEYPFVKQSFTTPEMIAWSVFNDAGNAHRATNSQTAIQAEVQQTTWAYNCTEHPWLNDAIFTSYQISNVAIEIADSLYIGLWNDFDLGCYTDDFIGSAPELSTYYTYNADATDGTVGTLCEQGASSFGENPPVQAVTFLENKLDRFTYLQNGNIDPPPPIGATDPTTAPEYYNYLSGHFRDGTPMTPGGSGYNPDSNLPPVSYAFPDNPNDPNGWSITTEELLVGDRRVVGSHYVERLEPNEFVTLDIAFSLHQHPDSNHLQTVNLMYEQVEELQELYSRRFTNLCEQPSLCTEDCVWPGDANADGIANHVDLLTLRFEDQRTGNLRSLPLNWAPVDGTPWATGQLINNGVNNKHADCDANGQITSDDFAVTQMHYEFTRPGYRPLTDVYTDGPELYFRGPGIEDGTLELSAEIPTRAFIDVRLAEDAPDVRAIAFNIEYDTDYIEVKDMGAPNDYFGEGRQERSIIYINGLEPGEIDVAAYTPQSENSRIERFFKIMLQIDLRNDFSAVGIPGDLTCIRLKNIIAYDNNGNRLMIGSETLKISFGEGVPVSTEDNISNTEQVEAFPNPAMEKLTLRWQNLNVKEYVILDVTGQVLQQNTGSWNGHMALDIQYLPAGIYFLQFINVEDKLLKPVRFIKL